MPKRTPPLGVRMEINGVPYDHFISFSVDRSLENFSGSFNCTTSNVEYQNYPISFYSQVKIIINNIPIVTGYIDTLSPSVSASDHAVSLSGRDITCDIIDSTLAADSVELETPIPMITLIDTTQKALGLNLTIIDSSGSKPFASDDLVSCKAGEGAFAFIERYARKLQVFVTTNGKGEIIVTRAKPVDTGIRLINMVNGADNNVISSSASFNNSQRYGIYSALSQANLNKANESADTDLGEAVYIKSGAVYDNEMRKSRVYNFIAETPTDGTSIVDRVKWEQNIRRARSLSYTATVQGLLNPLTGLPYELNGLAYVRDDLLNFDLMMLIRGIKHEYSLTSGELTTFELTYPDAYTLEISEPNSKEKGIKKVGAKGKTSKTG